MYDYPLNEGLEVTTITSKYSTLLHYYKVPRRIVENTFSVIKFNFLG